MSNRLTLLLALAFIPLSALAAGFTREQPCTQGASSVTFIGGVASVPERTEGCS